MHITTCAFRLVAVAFAVFISQPLSTAYAQADSKGDPLEQMRRFENNIATEMTRAMTCAMRSDLKKAALYCSTKFRSLHVEFAGVNDADPSGRKIQIRSMGANQVVSSLGRKCMLVYFQDPDFLPTGAIVLFRDDAVIEGFDAAKEAACQ